MRTGKDIFDYIPDELITEEDKTLTHADQLRMQTMVAGDIVSAYAGFREIQQMLIADEKARARLIGEVSLSENVA